MKTKSSISGPGGFHPIMYGKMTMFRAPEDDPPGGGGAGEDDFTKKFNKLFHAASKERDNRILKQLDEKLKGVSEALGTSLAAKMDELKGLLKVDDDDDADAKKKSGLSPEVEAALRQAQKDAADAKAESSKYAKERDEERNRNDRSEERQMILAELSGKIRPELLDVMVDQLHAKNITRDPDTKRVLFKSGDDEVVPFKDGLAEWMKSDTAKAATPPRDVGGGGGRQPRGGGQAPGPMDLTQLGEIVSGSIPGGSR